MFAEIGYKKYIDDSGYRTIYIDDENGAYIEFDNEIKCYKSNIYICIEELQAINKKCEELGWLDEDNRTIK